MALYTPTLKPNLTRSSTKRCSTLQRCEAYEETYQDRREHLLGCRDVLSLGPRVTIIMDNKMADDMRSGFVAE